MGGENNYNHCITPDLRAATSVMQPWVGNGKQKVWPMIIQLYTVHSLKKWIIQTFVSQNPFCLQF